MAPEGGEPHRQLAPDSGRQVPILTAAIAHPACVSRNFQRTAPQAPGAPARTIPATGRLLVRLFPHDRHVVDLATEARTLWSGNRLDLASSQGWLIALPVAGLALGIVVAGAVGGLAGIYPAFRAANTPPTEALRS